jgi:hypothetical protein
MNPHGAEHVLFDFASALPSRKSSAACSSGAATRSSDPTRTTARTGTVRDNPSGTLGRPDQPRPGHRDAGRQSASAGRTPFLGKPPRLARSAGPADPGPAHLPLPNRAGIARERRHLADGGRSASRPRSQLGPGRHHGRGLAGCRCCHRASAPRGREPVPCRVADRWKA